MSDTPNEHGKFAIKVDGEEIDHADTRAEAKHHRDAIIYGGIGTENNTTIETRWNVTYILDGEEDMIRVTAADKRGARYAAQLNFGSPIDITKIEKI